MILICVNFYILLYPFPASRWNEFPSSSSEGDRNYGKLQISLRKHKKLTIWDGRNSWPPATMIAVYFLLIFFVCFTYSHVRATWTNHLFQIKSEFHMPLKVNGSRNKRCGGNPTFFRSIYWFQNLLKKILREKINIDIIYREELFDRSADHKSIIYRHLLILNLIEYVMLCKRFL